MLQQKTYSSWTELFHEAWHHGMENMDPIHLEAALERNAEDYRSSFLRGADEPCVRPSGGLNCAAMAQLIARGHGKADEDLPRLLFSLGHNLHNLSYAALQSALPPEDFEIIVEEEIDLWKLDFWPQDITKFKRHGHVDLQVRCKNDAWLRDGVPRYVVCDAKTKHSLGMKQLKDIIEPEGDVWGNIDQLAIYSAVLGSLDNGGLLLYVNREAPKNKGAQFAARYVFPEHVIEAFENVKRRVILAGDPNSAIYPEMWEYKQNSKTKVFVPCQGYCSVQAACEAERARMGV